MYAFLGERKLTKEEWAEHKKHDRTNFYCDTYEDFSADFDALQESHKAKRRILRAWYVDLCNAPLNEDWVDDYAEFSDSYKDIYGERPELLGKILSHMGKTEEDYRNIRRAME